METNYTELPVKSVGNIIDEEVLKSKKYHGEETIELPSISRFVIDSAKSDDIRDVLLKAFEIKEYRYIKKFRDSIHKINIADQRTLIDLRKQISDDVDVFLDSHPTGKINKVSFKIMINPMNYIDKTLDGISLDLSVEGELDLKRIKHKKVVNNIFLKKVIKNM